MPDDFDSTHHAAPLSIELENGEIVDFARVTLDQWAKWKSRLAGCARKAVLKAMLADTERAPDSAIYKLANEELTRRRPLREVVAFVTSEPAYISRLLIEQAVAGGSDRADAVKAVGALSSFDKTDLAELLASEAVMAIPLLIPLARHRAKLAANQAKREMWNRVVAGPIASAMPSVPTYFGNDSAFAMAS
jgi:hypothetical protein